jgi:hypothetical protein
VELRLVPLALALGCSIHPIEPTDAAGPSLDAGAVVVIDARPLPPDAAPVMHDAHAGSCDLAADANCEAPSSCGAIDVSTSVSGVIGSDDHARCGQTGVPDVVYRFVAIMDGWYTFTASSSGNPGLINFGSSPSCGCDLPSCNQVGGQFDASEVSNPWMAKGDTFVFVFEGPTGSPYSMTVEYHPLDFCGDATIADLGGALGLVASGNIDGAYHRASCCSPDAPVARYRWTAPADGTYRFSSNREIFLDDGRVQADFACGAELACIAGGGLNEQLLGGQSIGVNVTAPGVGHAGYSIEVDEVMP